MRVGGRRAAILMAAIVLLAIIGPTSSPATASGGWHAYAVGILQVGNYQYGFGAVQQLRPDIMASPSADCMFQSTWLGLTNDNSNFLELGTHVGSNCYGGGQYGPLIQPGDWYWLYRTVYGMNVIGRAPHGPGPWHVFYIVYSGYNGGGYSIGIDNTLLAFVSWPGVLGYYGEVGLESYDQTGAEPWYSGQQLKYAFNGGPWTSPGWSNHAEVTYPANGVCGFFVSATEWRATETPGNANCD